MKLLMEVMTNIDAANLMGQRAFDIINNQEIKKNLVRAEARVKRDRKFESLITSTQEWVIRKTVGYVLSMMTISLTGSIAEAMFPIALVFLPGWALASFLFLTPRSKSSIIHSLE
ncbi:hypothetical protein ACSQ67_023915 [Phaseolus vulgaris]